MALAGSSPTSTTVRPGVTPHFFSSATSRATRSRTPRATAAPSMRRASVSMSACKVHRPRLANHHDLDLSRILQLGLDTPRDLLAQGGHAHVVHLLRRHDDAHLAPRLNREHAVHAAVARRDALEPLEPLHVRLERLAPRAGARAADRVGRLHEHADLALVRHVV